MEGTGLDLFIPNMADFCDGVGFRLVSSIKVGLDKNPLSVGEKTTLRIEALNLFNTQMDQIPRLVCTTNPILVASVDVANRLVEGLSEGSTILTVSDGCDLTAQVTVVIEGQLPHLVNLCIDPSNVELLVGKDVQLNAYAVDSDGNTIYDVSVSWSGSGSVASVDDTGLVRGLSVGTATIKASTLDNSLQAYATINVISIGRVHIFPEDKSMYCYSSWGRYSAYVYDSQGNYLPGYPVQWSTSDPAIATIDQSGVVSALSWGLTSVYASCEGIRGESNLYVNDPLYSTSAYNTLYFEGYPAELQYPGSYSYSHSGLITSSGFSASIYGNIHLTGSENRPSGDPEYSYYAVLQGVSKYVTCTIVYLVKDADWDILNSAFIQVPILVTWTKETITESTDAPSYVSPASNIETYSEIWYTTPINQGGACFFSFEYNISYNMYVHASEQPVFQNYYDEYGNYLYREFLHWETFPGEASATITISGSFSIAPDWEYAGLIQLEPG